MKQNIAIVNPSFNLTKSELVRELRMGKQTLYKNFKDLEELGVVVVSRKVGKTVPARYFCIPPMP